MAIYARVEDGVVQELIQPMTYDIDSPPGANPTFKAGDEVPITARYNIALIEGPISTMVDITEQNPMPAVGWTYADSKFSAPGAGQSS